MDFLIHSKKIVKGVPTACSQSYKANQKLQEKKIPTPTTSGNDVLPLPLIIPAKPVTQAKGEQRAFTTAPKVFTTCYDISKLGGGGVNANYGVVMKALGPVRLLGGGLKWDPGWG